MKTIGIIGGMGPLATADIFKKIIIKTKAENDQEHIHVLIDSNTNIPDRTKSIIENGENPLVEMTKSALILEKAGADFLIMPCNTAHYYFDELINKINIPSLNMLELTAKYIKNKFGNSVTVGLLATDGTNKSRIYDKYFNEADIKLIKPEKSQKYVMEFIYEGVKKGNYTMGTNGFFNAVNELEVKGADIMILGCTELSAVSEIYEFNKKFIDPMDILAVNAIKFAGGNIND